METREMIKNPALWAGLNKPDQKVEDADIVIFGIPYDGATTFAVERKKRHENFERLHIQLIRQQKISKIFQI